MKVGKAFVVLIGCSFIAACSEGSGDTEVISQLKTSELHLGTGNCGDGPVLRFANGRLFMVNGEGRGIKFDYPASVEEISGNPVIEFGKDPLKYQWILEPSNTKDTFRIDGHFKNPISEEEKEYYKRTTGRTPEQINQIWNSLQTVTVCAPK